MKIILNALSIPYILLFILILPLSSCLLISDTAKIEGVIIASSVDSNQRPLDVTNTFYMDQQFMYFHISVGNVTNETKVAIRVILLEGDLEDKRNMEIGYSEKTISESTHITFQFGQDDNLFPRGNYEVEISINGKLVETSSFFTVEKPAAAQFSIFSIPYHPTSSSENISGIYHWHYKGKEYTLEMNIPESIYDYYKSRFPIITSDPNLYSIYVTHPLDDELMSELGNDMKNLSIQQGFSADEFAEFILSFVRGLPYISDKESTPYDEYPRFPIQTLIDREGDCEDTSILLATIYKSAGLDPVLLLSKSKQHVAIGIAGQGGSTRTFYDYAGKQYYYLESTKSNLPPGYLPSGYIKEDFEVVPLEPIPLVGHAVNEFRNGKVHRVRTFLWNFGANDAENVIVKVTLLSDDGTPISSENTQSFNMGIYEEAIATFYLDCQSTGANTIIVETTYNNHKYITEHQIECK